MKMSDDSSLKRHLIQHTHRYGNRDTQRQIGVTKGEVDLNRQLPNYSKIAQVETVLVPFEKTPKMSIKRFLYK